MGDNVENNNLNIYKIEELENTRDIVFTIKTQSTKILSV